MRGARSLPFRSEGDVQRHRFAAVCLDLCRESPIAAFLNLDAMWPFGHLNEESCTHGPEVGVLQNRFNLAQFIGLGLGLVIVGLMVLATEGL